MRNFRDPRRSGPRAPHATAPIRWAGAAALVMWLFLGLGPAIAQPTEPADSNEAQEAFETQGKKKFRRSQPRPIDLGTSGGSLLDIGAEFCCSGTLGALVEKNGVRHILSNNHVIARSNAARKGEPIIQPGLIDQERTCVVPNPEAQAVAELSAKKRLKFGGIKKNKVDAAIAEVRPGAVDPDGRILKLGIPGDTPIDPQIGMQVVKVGRSSGLTRGVVFAVNVTAPDVSYPTECGSDDERMARFVKQFVVMGIDKDFSKGGDSGAMIYQDAESCPAPVGLLFAGNDTLTLASPAKTVQKIMANRSPKGEVSFVGCSAVAKATPAPLALARPRALLDERDVRAATRVKERRERELLALPGVEGIGVGIRLSGPAEPAIHVFVSEDGGEMVERLPAEIDGYRVEVVETGRFVAY